jgi:uncharacterized protein (TIRG00374 family)
MILANKSNAEASMESASPTALRRRLSAVAKVAATLLIFGYVAYTVDLSAAWKQAATQSLPMVVLAGLILMAQAGLGGIRWFIILRTLGAGSSLWETLRLFYISIFFNSFVWSGLGGDLVRTWLSYRSNVSVRTSITSVLLDRVAALVAVALLVLLTTPVLLSRVGLSISMLVPAFLSALGLIGILIAAQFDRLPARWLEIRPLRLLGDLGSAVRTVFLRPAVACPLAGVAIVGQIALAAATYALAVGLRLDISLLECIALMQPVALLANLPISIGGWGVRETAMITLFGLIGIPAATALALSVQLGLLSLVVSLPGGLLWLSLKSRAPTLSASHPAEAQRVRSA